MESPFSPSKSTPRYWGYQELSNSDSTINNGVGWQWQFVSLLWFRSTVQDMYCITGARHCQSLVCIKSMDLWCVYIRLCTLSTIKLDDLALLLCYTARHEREISNAGSRKISNQCKSVLFSETHWLIIWKTKFVPIWDRLDWRERGYGIGCDCMGTNRRFLPIKIRQTRPFVTPGSGVVLWMMERQEIVFQPDGYRLFNLF